MSDTLFLAIGMCFFSFFHLLSKIVDYKKVKYLEIKVTQEEIKPEVTLFTKIKEWLDKRRDKKQMLENYGYIPEVSKNE